MIKVIIDAMGGDRSPDANVEGALMAIEKYNDLFVYIVGDLEKINPLLEDKKYDKERVELINAPEVIGYNEAPTMEVFHKKESSMMKSVELLRNSEDIAGIVSTGNSGALLVASILRIGKLPGIKRPCFAPIIPTMDHSVVTVVDSGANVDCSPEELYQFAIMGSIYMEKTQGIENPKVALLNDGTEEGKGDKLRKEIYPLLKDAPINFVGNMESRDFLTGKYNVVVADGFSGNVLVKSTEGACLEMLKLLKKTFTSSFKNKMGALFLKKDIYKLKDFMDYNNYGGAMMLGLKKTVVKGHGSSKAISVFHCIEQVYDSERNHLSEAIANILSPKEEAKE